MAGRFDAEVVGAGPNGLSAAVALARAGMRVRVSEAAPEIGGGTRTAELTLPGYRHDVCSAIHPSAKASPFFDELGLEVDWIDPPLSFSHPLDGGRAVAMYRSVEATAAQLGEDAPAYLSLMRPLVDGISDTVADVLSPPTLNPANKAAFARVAALGALPMAVVAKRFSTDEARAFLAGLGAHAIAPLTSPATAGVGLMLGAIGHSHGWPVAKGGSQRIAEALARQLEELGGEILTGRPVVSPRELEGDVALLDLMPPAILALFGSELSASSRRRLGRWEPGPGVFKVDWALDGPIPWTDELSRHSATIHLGGGYDEIAEGEAEVVRGGHPERPFVLFAQQSLFDDTRAPDGKHTAWGYCHVPNGSTIDMSDRIEAQVERFAPGFQDLVLARTVTSPAEFEQYNPNYVGGDIGGGRFGVGKILQIGAKRPYRLGSGLYVCSSAAPPGAGTHGMCGYHAAMAALG